MEKVCKVCGRTLLLEMFSKIDGYYRNVCKDCQNEKRREYRKKHPQTEKEKERRTLKCALRREKLKAETGKTYRNKKDAERQRAYSQKYSKEHRGDEKFLVVKRRCQQNSRNRQRMIREIEALEEFFTINFDF